MGKKEGSTNGWLDTEANAPANALSQASSQKLNDIGAQKDKKLRSCLQPMAEATDRNATAIILLHIF
jgi:hypothetical protein